MTDDVTGRIRDLQDSVDTLIKRAAAKKVLMTDYIAIGKLCSDALSKIIERKDLPGIDIESIALARTLVDGYGSILKMEHRITDGEIDARYNEIVKVNEQLNREKNKPE